MRGAADGLAVAALGAGAQLAQQRRRALDEQLDELVDDLRVVVAEDAHAGLVDERLERIGGGRGSARRGCAGGVPSQRSSAASSSSGRSGLER